MLVKQCHKPPIYWNGLDYTSYKNGDLGDSKNSRFTSIFVGPNIPLKKKSRHFTKLQVAQLENPWVTVPLKWPPDHETGSQWHGAPKISRCHSIFCAVHFVPLFSHYYPILSHIIPYYPILSHIIPLLSHYYPIIIPLLSLSHYPYPIIIPLLSHYYPILSHCRVPWCWRFRRWPAVLQAAAYVVELREVPVVIRHGLLDNIMKYPISNLYIYIYIQILWMIFPIKDFEISHIPLVIPLMGDFPSDLHLEGGFPIWHGMTGLSLNGTTIARTSKVKQTPVGYIHCPCIL